MDKIKDFLKKHVKATVIVAMFGVAATLAFSSDGCSVDVAPTAVSGEVTETVIAPATP